MQTILSIFILYKRIELLNEDSKEGTEKGIDKLSVPFGLNNSIIIIIIDDKTLINIIVIKS